VHCRVTPTHKADDLAAVQEMKRVKPFFSRTLADDEQEDPHREQLDGHRDYGYIPHGLV